MKTKFLILFFLTVSFNFSYATHILGGNFNICQTSSNDYDVSLYVFRDCGSGSSASIYPSLVCVFDAVTHNQVLNFDMSTDLISIQPILYCDSVNPWLINGLCVEEYLFQSSIQLPDNPNGYYITWTNCCRSSTIMNLSNPGSSGSTFYVQIPDPALWNGTFGNCTPFFGNYPNTPGFLNNNHFNILDFSAYDADGDSLSYSLITPLDENNCTSKPFNECNWATGFSTANVLGNSVSPMSIDPVTGMITCTPMSLGNYAFSVMVEEWRNGIKIGEIIRDITMSSISMSGQFYTDFTVNQQILNSQPYIFEFTNLTPNPTDYIFYWDFGDGSLVQDNSLTVTHQYSTTGQYDVVLLAFDTMCNNCCQESNIKLAYITCTTLLSDFIEEAAEISIYPNPVKNNIIININGYQGLIKTELFDMTGNKVTEFNSTTISMEKYAKGSYIIKVFYGELPKTFHVIKN